MSTAMSPKVIRITIEEIVQDGEKYYLARSPDVRWFLTQTDTIEEMMELAPQVMSDFLEASKKIMEKEQEKKLVQKSFSQTTLWKQIVYDLNYRVTPHLQLA